MGTASRAGQFAAKRFTPVLLAITLTMLAGQGASLQGKPGAVTCLPAPGNQPRPVCKSTYDKLDKLLAAKDWNGLGEALAPSADIDAFTASIDWSGERITSGRGGFTLATFHARNLWVVGDAMKVADPNSDSRLTAALMTLYAFAVIRVDGTECEDASSPNKRAEQLIQQRAAALRFLASQSKDLKDRVVAIALAMEREQGPQRPHNDEMLCNYGMESMMAGINAGRAHEIPNPGGYVGKTMDVSPPPDWKPKFVLPEIYEPAKIKARSELRQALE